MQLQIKLEKKKKKKKKKNVFRTKQTTNKVSANIFRGCKVMANVRFMFWKPKYSLKGKS